MNNATALFAAARPSSSSFACAVIVVPPAAIYLAIAAGSFIPPLARFRAGRPLGCPPALLRSHCHKLRGSLELKV